MACPFLSGEKQKGCIASNKFVVLCKAELEGKCLLDSKYPECNHYQSYKREVIIK